MRVILLTEFVSKAKLFPFGSLAAADPKLLIGPLRCFFGAAFSAVFLPFFLVLFRFRFFRPIQSASGAPGRRRPSPRPGPAPACLERPFLGMLRDGQLAQLL